MNDRKAELGQEKLGRLLVKQSAPATVGMVFNALYNIIDTIFVGQGVGTLALAGLAIVFPFQMIIMAASHTVGIGAASVISRALGAGEGRKAERVAGTSITAAAVMGVVVALLSWALLGPILRVFGAIDEVLPYAAEYMSIVLFGNVFIYVTFSANNCIRAEGNAKAAMTTMIIGAVVNTILDPVFIFGFGMGIGGAALATVIAQCCSFLFVVYYFLSGRSLLRFKWRDLAPDMPLINEVVGIGFPSFVRHVAGNFSAIVIFNTIGYYGTAVHLAIVGIIMRIMIFLVLPLFGLVQGLQPIVGFNYGARKMRRVKEALMLSFTTASAYSTAFFLLLFIFPNLVLNLFSSDARLIGEGTPIMRIGFFAFAIIGFQVVGSSFFQAVGKAGPALFLAMSRQLLFLVPLMLLLPLFMGLDGVWYSFPIADILATAVTALMVWRELIVLKQQAQLHAGA